MAKNLEIGMLSCSLISQSKKKNTEIIILAWNTALLQLCTRRSTLNSYWEKNAYVAPENEALEQKLSRKSCAL